VEHGPNSLSTLDVWTARDHLQRFIREFFHRRRYIEVDTPMGVLCPGTEVHLNYFSTKWTDHRGIDRPLFLRSSPELHLKQAIAAGVPRAFHLARCFRNKGEMSAWHHPEFTMLEWYETKITYEGMIKQTESLIHEAAKTIKALARKKKWDLSPTPLPRVFTRISVADAFHEFAKLDLVDQDPDLARKARAMGYHSVRTDDDFETAYFKILLDKIEPSLARIGGAVLMDYPPSQSALAVIKGGVARRFEFYVASPIQPQTEVVEICNGFEELLGEEENRRRIKAANLLRAAAGNAPVPEDPDYFAALGRGLAACCGNALGFDRLLALALGESNLDRVIPFRKAALWQD